MGTEKCITVVPVYRAPADRFERESFERTCKRFGEGIFNALCIVTHEGVDLTEYESIAKKAGVNFEVRHFPKEKFGSIHGYNLLMLDPSFYKKFMEYEYMLICQLDAMILGHDLDRWLRGGYDYIGGPIFAPGYNGKADFATVGNGGFCLRKISSMVRALGGDGPLTWKEIFSIRRPYDPKFTLKKKILYTTMVAASGRSAWLRGMLSHWVMEDTYFSYALKSTPWELKVPSALEASEFAIDLGPEFWYKANGGILPFGAHKYGVYEGYYNACRHE